MKELYNLLEIQPLDSSPYHPQTDGILEQFHSTVKSMLKKIMYKFNSQCDSVLPYILFAYQEVPSESTGFSPLELLFGKCDREPLYILRKSC